MASNNNDKNNSSSKLPSTSTSTSDTAADKELSSMSDTAYLKAGGWGNMKNFALSYGEKPDPDGFENAKIILGAMRQNHESSAAGRAYREEGRI
ncbi:hypothetical protein DV736_g81, partial [Chaetothyriales sp. CBS 134916]